MHEIHKQVRRAYRRLMAQFFLTRLPWCLFGSMLVACIAIIVPKLWPLTSDPQAAVEPTTWAAWWLGGSAVFGLCVALIWTYVGRGRELDAALQIDERFGLKERVSSSLALRPEDLNSPAGQALVSDATHRMERVEVKEAFRVKMGWPSLLPLVTATAALLIGLFVQDAVHRSAEAGGLDTQELKKEIDESAEKLKKRLEKQRQDAEAKGLKDAEEIFEKMQRGLDDLQKKNDGDYKKALVKINNLTEELENRQKQLGGSREIQKQLEQLKNIDEGPADKMAKALKDGNFKKALEEIRKLQDQMKDGELTPEQKEQLAQQMEQIKQQLEDMAKAHQDAKKSLEQQIAQKKQEGDSQAAQDLQKQLDQLNDLNDQMSQLNKMAQQLGQSQQAMNQGDMQSASESLEELAQSLEQMQSELDELQTLTESMDQIANAKDAMCKACTGNGMSGMGSGFSNRFSENPGNGLGPGRGFGDRPEEETEVGSYESREKGKIKRGEAVKTGDAFGPNQTGRSLVDVQQQIEGAVSEDPDPILNERLPRTEKRHSSEYFERIRGN